MPNWVDNVLTIKGEPQDIKKLKEQLAQPYSETIDSFDTTTKQMVRQVINHDEPFSFWNIVRPPEDKMDEYHTAHGWSNGQETGRTPFNWYNWNLSNWGCKWDASQPQLSTDRETELVYTFNTPWSPPEAVMFSLSEQYPNTDMWLRYEEEQGWGGVDHFINGEQETEEAWDIPESHADNVAIDRDCVCSWSDDQEYWFDDCPREEIPLKIE